MQSILNSIQEGTITQKTLLAKLVEHENKNVAENDSLIDLIEERDATIKDHEYTLTRQHEALLKQDNDKKIFLENQNRQSNSNVVLNSQIKTLEHQLKVARKEAKTQKEQIKRNKAAMSAKDSRIKSLEKNDKKASKNPLGELNTVYCVGSEVLVIYPTQLELGIDGVRSKQSVLLYSNRKGAFVTVFLNAENKVKFATFLNDDHGLAQRTVDTFMKHTMQPSNEAAEYAERWLTKVNVIQKMKIKNDDLVCYRGDEK